MKLTNAGSLRKVSAALGLCLILGATGGCMMILPRPKSGYLDASWPQDRLATKPHKQAGSCQFVRIPPGKPPQTLWGSILFVPLPADEVDGFLLTVKDGKVVAEAAIFRDKIYGGEIEGGSRYTHPIDQIIPLSPRLSIPPEARHPAPYCELCARFFYWFGMIGLGFYEPNNIFDKFYPKLYISGERYLIVVSAEDSYIKSISQVVGC